MNDVVPLPVLLPLFGCATFLFSYYVINQLPGLSSKHTYGK